MKIVLNKENLLLSNCRVWHGTPPGQNKSCLLSAGGGWNGGFRKSCPSPSRSVSFKSRIEKSFTVFALTSRRQIIALLYPSRDIRGSRCASTPQWHFEACEGFTVLVVPSPPPESLGNNRGHHVEGFSLHNRIDSHSSGLDFHEWHREVQNHRLAAAQLACTDRLIRTGNPAFHWDDFLICAGGDHKEGRILYN